MNPHMPKYISQKPWYLNEDGTDLHHQIASRTQKKTSLQKWYQRGVKKQTAFKYRKGACTNCGAMTHKRKFCMERPRKVGARFTNDDIAPDEVVENLELTYDAKTDNWNGYTPDMHMRHIKEHQKYEQQLEKER